LRIEELETNAGEVRSMISVLFGKLSVHLSMKDNVLYPSLIEHKDKNVRDMVRISIEEMVNIGFSIDQYNAKWKTSPTIQAEPEEFIQHTRKILDAVAERFFGENNELFELVGDV